MVLTPSLRAAIEDNYRLIITAAADGPRGLTGAQTFILTDSQDTRFFCKHITNATMIARMKASLPIAAALYDYGLSFVVAPLATYQHYYFMHANALVALFPFIEARPSRDYRPHALGAALGAVHGATPFISAGLPVRGMASVYDVFFQRGLDELLSHPVQDETAIGTLRNLLQTNEKPLRRYIDAFYKIGQHSQAPSVVTHGDAQGNVLLGTDATLSLIDWDEAELAPAERDLWFLSSLPGFMEGYTAVRNNFTPNPHLLLHGALKAWLEGFAIHVAATLESGRAGMSHVHLLAERRFSQDRLERLDAGLAQLGY